jgi:hypothetical protein
LAVAVAVMDMDCFQSAFEPDPPKPFALLRKGRDGKPLKAVSVEEFAASKQTKEILEVYQDFKEGKVRGA